MCTGSVLAFHRGRCEPTFATLAGCCSLRRARRLALLKATAWLAWLLAIPAVAFELFFLNALLTSRGPWNPATDEVVLVPLTWLGSLILPAAGFVLNRVANRAEKPTVS